MAVGLFFFLVSMWKGPVKTCKKLRWDRYRDAFRYEYVYAARIVVSFPDLFVACIPSRHRSPSVFASVRGEKGFEL